ncbi:putative regulatory protein [Streptomyces mashuensis]|uniref:Regulatory protein n=1 Tax=Streptomyces mashuensis TaxID=33904 RepID=A0A919AXN6_9ACTN|nr:helix-turn-helix domain-containing protein [Streptomyces mashuensis]GHF29861.1 putative regulatory protein [Streptomyces mashuensis]
MIRIRLGAEDVAGVRFAPRPAPLQELNTALSMLFLPAAVSPSAGLLSGRWRQRVLRALPAAMEPLGDLVPGGRAPLFLDEFRDGLAAALDAARETEPALVRGEIERVYAGHAGPVPPWVRALHRGDEDAWQQLRRARHAAFEAVVRPVWPVVQDLHREEFTRYALAVAEHGTGAVLAGLVPGARLAAGVWELPSPEEREVVPAGRGVVLVPTFHWTGHPLLSDVPGRPVHVTYPAGRGLPPGPDGPYVTEDALAAVLGRTRLGVLLVLAEEHTTGGLARRLGVSAATASAHAAALRGAGLVDSVRAGRSVVHRRTALGGLLVGRLG